MNSDSSVARRVRDLRVAVLGGTGFIGSYLVDALLQQGHRPALLVRRGSEHRVPRPGACRLLAGDVGDPGAVRELLAEADAAIYSIGILRESPGRTFEDLHYAGVMRAIDASQAAGVRRFVLVSANGVAPSGTPYARTKYRAEEALVKSGLDYTIFRPSVVFGDPRGRDEIATRLYRQMIRPPLPAPWFHRGLWPRAESVRLSPVHVEDVAEAIVNALGEKAAIGRTFRLGGAEALSFKAVLERIAAAAGRRKLLLPMPVGLMFPVAFALDRFGWFPVTRDQLRMLAAGNIAPAADLQKLTGRDPRPFSAPQLDYLVRNDRGS